MKRENRIHKDKISVIIPVYNDQGTLESAINSVLRQTYTNIEIIIIDDGSDFSPEPIINRIGDARISLYRIERGNANIARNFGIQKSTGEYIAMLDADDYWLQNHLSSCLEILNNFYADGLYGSLILSYNHQRGIIDNNIDESKTFFVRELKEDESMIDYLLSTCIGAQTSTLFTTAVSTRDIMWDAMLLDHQDYDFVIRYCKKYRMIPKMEPTVIYYLSSGRLIHFESCISCIKNYIDDIEPNIYNDYNLRMYLRAIQLKASGNIIKYFRNEATRYKAYISYQKYISIRDPKTFLHEVREKIGYIIEIILIKFNNQDGPTP